MADKDLAVDQETQEGAEAQLDENIDVEGEDEDELMERLKEAVTVKKEEVGNLRVKLTVGVPRDVLDERMGKEYDELRREAVVPGFRKGHAPLRLIEKRFGSDVGNQLKGQLLSSGYLAAVEKEELKPLGDPDVWVTVEEERKTDDGKKEKVKVEKLVSLERALDHIEMPAEGDLNFQCEIELKPEFDLPELSKIPVEKPKLAVTDEQVENEMKRLTALRGSFEPVEGGKVEEDDMLYGDAKLTVGDVVLLEEDNYDAAARDMVIKGVPLKGFKDAVLGKKQGDTASADVTVPDDHEDLDLRGKKAKFEFKVSEIKRLVIPPIDEEFLKQAGFESEDELRDTIKTNLEGRLEQEVKEHMRQQVGDYLIEKTNIEVPEGLSKRQSERSVARRMVEMYQHGVPQAEIEKALDEMRLSAQEQAARDLKLFFIMEKVAEDREVDVAEEEINGAIAMMAQRTGKRFDRVRDELSKDNGLMMLYMQIRDAKVIDTLLDEAEVTEVEGPKTGDKKGVAKKPAAKKKSTKKKAAKKSAKKSGG